MEMKTFIIQTMTCEYDHNKDAFPEAHLYVDELLEELVQMCQEKMSALDKGTPEYQRVASVMQDALAWKMGDIQWKTGDHTLAMSDYQSAMGKTNQMDTDLYEDALLDDVHIDEVEDFLSKYGDVRLDDECIDDGGDEDGEYVMKRVYTLTNQQGKCTIRVYYSNKDCIVSYCSATQE